MGYLDLQLVKNGIDIPSNRDFAHYVVVGKDLKKPVDCRNRDRKI